MFCRNCGKELSDEAIMCPECGTPVESAAKARAAKTAAQTVPEASGAPMGIIGFFLSIFAFVTGIVFGSFLLVFYESVLLLYILDATTILPGIAGIASCICGLKQEKGAAKALSVTGIILAGIVLLFLFIGGCVLVAA